MYIIRKNSVYWIHENWIVVAMFIISFSSSFIYFYIRDTLMERKQDYIEIDEFNRRAPKPTPSINDIMIKFITAYSLLYILKTYVRNILRTKNKKPPSTLFYNPNKIPRGGSEIEINAEDILRNCINDENVYEVVDTKLIKLFKEYIKLAPIERFNFQLFNITIVDLRLFIIILMTYLSRTAIINSSLLSMVTDPAKKIIVKSVLGSTGGIVAVANLILRRLRNKHTTILEYLFTLVPFSVGYALHASNLFILKSCDEIIKELPRVHNNIPYIELVQPKRDRIILRPTASNSNKELIYMEKVVSKEETCTSEKKVEEYVPLFKPELQDPKPIHKVCITKSNKKFVSINQQTKSSKDLKYKPGPRSKYIEETDRIIEDYRKNTIRKSQNLDFTTPTNNKVPEEYEE